MLMINWIDFGIGIVAIVIITFLASYFINKVTKDNNPDISEEDEERELFDDVHDKEYKNKYEDKIESTIGSSNVYQPNADPYHPVYNPDGYGAGMTNKGFMGNKN